MQTPNGPAVKYLSRATAPDNFIDSKPIKRDAILKNGTMIKVRDMHTPPRYNITKVRRQEERQKLRQM